MKKINKRIAGKAYWTVCEIEPDEKECHVKSHLAQRHPNPSHPLCRWSKHSKVPSSPNLQRLPHLGINSLGVSVSTTSWSGFRVTYLLTQYGGL